MVHRCAFDSQQKQSFCLITATELTPTKAARKETIAIIMLSWFSRNDKAKEDTSASESSSEEPKVHSMLEEQQKIEPIPTSTALIHFSLPSYVEPSHVMFGVSFPFFYRAYRLYRSPLESLVEKVAKKNHVTIAELEAADVGVRKAVGAAVAGRALRLATLISFGSFGMFGAGTFSYSQQGLGESIDSFFFIFPSLILFYWLFN